MKETLRRNEAAIFLVLVIPLSWILWALGTPEVLIAMPSAMALIMAFGLRGKAGGISLLRDVVRWRVGWVWWAFAVFGMLGILFVALAAFLVTGGDSPGFYAFKNESLYALLFLVIVFLPVFGPVGKNSAGEGMCYRGFNLPASVHWARAF